MNLESYINEHLIHSIVSMIKEGKTDDIFSYKSIKIDTEKLIELQITKLKDMGKSLAGNDTGKNIEDQLIWTNTGWKNFIDGKSTIKLKLSTGEDVDENIIEILNDNGDFDSIKNYIKFLGVDIDKLEYEDKEKKSDETQPKEKSEESNNKQPSKEEQEKMIKSAMLLLDGKKLVKDDQGKEKEEQLSTEEQKIIRSRIFVYACLMSYYIITNYERSSGGKSARKILPKLCSYLNGIGNIGEFHAMLTAIFLYTYINNGGDIDKLYEPDFPLYALIGVSTKNEQENTGVFIAIMLLATQNALSLGLNENDITKLFSLTGLFNVKK